MSSCVFSSLTDFSTFQVLESVVYFLVVWVLFTSNNQCQWFCSCISLRQRFTTGRSPVWASFPFLVPPYFLLDNPHPTAESLLPCQRLMVPLALHHWFPPTVRSKPPALAIKTVRLPISFCSPISISPTLISLSLPGLSVPPLPSWLCLLRWASPNVQSSPCSLTVTNFCLQYLSHGLFSSPQSLLCCQMLLMSITQWCWDTGV